MKKLLLLALVLSSCASVHEPYCPEPQIYSKFEHNDYLNEIIGNFHRHCFRVGKCLSIVSEVAENTFNASCSEPLERGGI